MLSKDLICVGVITGAKGLKGQVRLKAFTENPLTIGSYKYLMDDQGNKFTLITCTLAKEVVIASFEGIHDRTRAESLKGTKLFISRNQLPALDEEDLYYITDLIGLDVHLPNDKKIGKITSVHNFGAGDVVEFRHDFTGQDLMIPFKKEFVTDVEIKKGLIKVDPDYMDSLLALGDEK